MNLKSILTITLVTVFSFSTAYAEKPVAISKSDGPYSLELGVSVNVGEHKIIRNQNNKNTVNPSFAKTSRPCPPFCIQPMQLRPGIETIGEQEMIHYAVMMSKGQKMPDRAKEAMEAAFLEELHAKETVQTKKKEAAAGQLEDE